MRVLAAAVLALGLLALPAAASAGQSPGTAACSLSENAAGNLVVTVTGLEPGTTYGYYIDAPLPDGTVPSPGNGLETADGTGSITDAVGPVAYLMGEYPGTTYLVFDLYPQNFYPRHGNRDHILVSCTFTPA